MKDPNPTKTQKHILPQGFTLQTSVSEGCPLQIPPPTSMKDLVLVLVLAPSPQVVEQLDQALQGAQLQSITEKEKNMRYFILFQLTDHQFSSSGFPCLNNILTTRGVVIAKFYVVRSSSTFISPKSRGGVGARAGSCFDSDIVCKSICARFGTTGPGRPGCPFTISTYRTIKYIIVK